MQVCQTSEEGRESKSESLCVCVLGVEGRRRSKHTHMHRFCFTGQFFSCLKKKSSLPQTTDVGCQSQQRESTRTGKGLGGVWASESASGRGLTSITHQHRDLRVLGRWRAASWLQSQSQQSEEETVGVFKVRLLICALQRFRRKEKKICPGL